MIVSVLIYISVYNEKLHAILLDVRISVFPF